MDTESMWQAARAMRDAAESAHGAAASIDNRIQELRALTEAGYGNGLQSLLEALSKIDADGIFHARIDTLESQLAQARQELAALRGKVADTAVKINIIKGQMRAHMSAGTYDLLLVVENELRQAAGGSDG